VPAFHVVARSRSCVSNRKDDGRHSVASKCFPHSPAALGLDISRYRYIA
jgi:hypothetical protein